MSLRFNKVFSITPVSGGGGGGSAKKFGASIDDILGDVDENGVLQPPTGGEFDFILAGAKQPPAGTYNFMDALFYGNKNIRKASFPDLTSGGNNPMFSRTFQTSSITELSFAKLTSIEGASNMCTGCRSLTKVEFPSLTAINYSGLNQAFHSCSSLTTASFPELIYLAYSGLTNCFTNCSSLTSISFPKLKEITGYNTNVFSNCASLTSFTFPVLDRIQSQGMLYWFSGCTSLTSLSFPALETTSFNNTTNQFDNMLSGVTGCTVHFPSNLQSVIGDWSSVTSGFGGTNTVVLFDLEATE